MIRRALSTLCLAALASIVALAEPPRPGEEESLALHVNLPDWPQQNIRVAVSGALHRLSAPRCASLLSTFHDGAGRPLTARLSATGLTVRQYLTSLRFEDGTDHPRCHTDSFTVAFTQPGSRVVYVCGDRFAQTFPRESASADVCVIHEFLHSLGLGENPPTPTEISRAVRDRCGDDR